MSEVTSKMLDAGLAILLKWEASDHYDKRKLIGDIYSSMEGLSPKQAQIDRLMLEHCPEEMTDEQMANWRAHQVIVLGTSRTIAAIGDWTGAQFASPSSVKGKP